MWKKIERPGFFGRHRDEKIAALNSKYGDGNWKLVWAVEGLPDEEFYDACCAYYEKSYIKWFQSNIKEFSFLRQFGECYDNAITNTQSGTDYSRQEAFSTHIQDIAVRNVMSLFGVRFEGPPERLLEIRSRGDGLRYSPGVIPFYDQNLITQPSLCPKWAEKGSVEDFWQSNKWVVAKVDN